MKSMDSANGRNTVRCPLRLVSVVLTILFAVSGCGGEHPPSGSKAADPKAPPEAFPQDPTATIQGDWPSPGTEHDPADVVALGARLAYAYDQDDVGITAFRLDSGDVAWHTTIPEGSSVAQAPRLTGNMVIGAFATTKSGSGTYADRHGISVIAMEAGTGKTLWTREIATDNAAGAAVPHVVEADARHVLVASYEQGYSETPPLSALLDTRTGRVIWTDADFKAVDLEESVAVGIRDDGDLAGKSTSDGKQQWKRDLQLGEIRATDPGPGLTFADGTAAGGTLLIDAATGTTRLDSGDTSLLGCRYDGWNTTICAGADGSGNAAAWAVDVRTSDVLWRLPDTSTNRVAPEITSAWHGVVYAQADQAMTLDIRTGKDLRTSVGPISPTMVNDGYGLIYDDSARTIDVYRAADGSASD
ncbi:PQQ-binding-like beta-propeller repeat protein [Streptomyces roseoverticillatus]|uniref:outer membrane protein assembly factor BamB family protein n=1 Tax=Streptomyces roseoverticillatus TaxID=66429 RepID=UPI001F316DC5|nr:PQQ-binding-like beta-propeller repeat protein [Streptomyces roseoverticillatus]MCF3103148.1 PQQ-binding-like beta-propeller repeat protein [Streptomyces roseoverticillatus]